MKINHIANNAPVVAPTKDVAPGSARATSSSPATTTALDATRHTGDSLLLSVQQVSRQVGSDDFNTARIERIRNAIQSDMLKMNTGKIVDVTFSDVQSLLSTCSKKV